MEFVLQLNNDVLIQLLSSIAIAIVYGLASYFKVHKTERFSTPMFAKTILIGATVGFVEFYTGYTYQQAFAFVTSNTFLTIFIDDLVNKLLGHRIMKAEAKQKIGQTSTGGLTSKFCTNCGRDLEPNAKFCDRCGVPLNPPKE